MLFESEIARKGLSRLLSDVLLLNKTKICVFNISSYVVIFKDRKQRAILKQTSNKGV